MSKQEAFFVFLAIVVTCYFWHVFRREIARSCVYLFSPIADFFERFRTPKKREDRSQMDRKGGGTVVSPLIPEKYIERIFPGARSFLDDLDDMK